MGSLGYLTEVVGTGDGLDRDRDVVRVGATADHGRQQHAFGELEAADGVVGEVALAAPEPLRVGQPGDRDRQQRRGQPAGRRRLATQLRRAPA